MWTIILTLERWVLVNYDDVNVSSVVRKSWRTTATLIYGGRLVKVSRAHPLHFCRVCRRPMQSLGLADRSLSGNGPGERWYCYEDNILLIDDVEVTWRNNTYEPLSAATDRIADPTSELQSHSAAVRTDRPLIIRTHCSSCGAKNPARAVYCENCGELINATKCPTCGESNRPWANFCITCGQGLDRTHVYK